MTAYQKAVCLGRRWVSVGVLVLGSLVFASGPATGAPLRFDDTQKRFRLVLPEGWEPYPDFGDLQGMVFRRTARGPGPDRPIKLRVRVLDMREQDLSELFGSFQIDGYGPFDFEHAKRSTQSFDGRTYQMLEAPRVPTKSDAGADEILILYYAEETRFIYGLGFLGTAANLRRFESERSSIFRSFVPEAHLHVTHETYGDSGPSASSQNPAGTWRNGDGLVMVLREDATFTLAKLKGRYTLEDGELTLIIPDQGRESFVARFENNGNRMILSSSSLPEPMAYQRIGDASVGATPPGKAPEVAPVDVEAKLVGRWENRADAKARIVLNLTKDHRFVLGSTKGGWRVEDGRLRLEQDAARVIAYEVSFSEEDLVLSGADLDQPLVLRRRGSD
jgi:hypothetical protein